MMNRVFILIAILLLQQTATMAQGFISMKRPTIKKQLIEFYDKHKVATRFVETDSSLICYMKDSTGTDVRKFTYSFKKNNRCYKETAEGNCEPCFTKLFDDATLAKRYKWKKISDNLYLSKPLWNLTLIRADEEQSFSYTIVKDYFSRTAHTKLYKSNR
ncbi:MAG TPA: hypothetical protein VFV46_06165 [Lacibacter sp.]|nr:hypothetical protein [Lacibacter sp.]